MPELIAPHGGSLVDLMVGDASAAALKSGSREWPSLDLDARQMCDLELLVTGGFSPLRGFMGRADYEAVLAGMRLADGTLWPIPVTLDVPESVAKGLEPGGALALRDPEGVMLAVLHVEEVWRPDRVVEAEAVYGTRSPRHLSVAARPEDSRPYVLGGRVDALELPAHYDFRRLRLSPREVRAELCRLGRARAVAFQTREPMHRAEFEFTRGTAAELDASLLIHAVVGMAGPGRLDHYTRMRCYEALLRRYPPDTARLALLPLAERMAGRRAALWHAIIEKNYGCSAFVVVPFHGTHDIGRPDERRGEAQELVRAHEKELGVSVVPLEELYYAEDEKRFGTRDQTPEGSPAALISEGGFAPYLFMDAEIPDWLSFPEVIEALRVAYPPRSRRGFTLFFTGLSGSGKSTIARIVLERLLERGGRPVTLLDGDLVRKHLSSELGFSKEHRDINIRRIGYVASEITKNHGIAICAPIAPYDSVRKDVRRMIQPLGGFFLIHVATPLEVCEARDRKGLYAKARAGIIKEFTGISDPYDEPEDAELRIDTTRVSAEEAAGQVIEMLEREGYLPAAAEPQN